MLRWVPGQLALAVWLGVPVPVDFNAAEAGTGMPVMGVRSESKSTFVNVLPQWQELK